MKKVLVTGGNSYIGKHCIAQLIDKGYHVKTSVRSKEKAKQLNLDLTEYLKRDTKIEYTIADLLHDDGWDEAIKECHYVLHLASPLMLGFPKDPDDIIKPNSP